MNFKSILVSCGWLALVSCAPSSGEHEHDHIGSRSQLTFSNGDFEDGTANAAPPNWIVTTYTNPGVTYPPTSRAQLNLGNGGIAGTITLYTAAGAESQFDSDLGAGSTLRWPKYGNKVAVVNRVSTSSQTANSLKQTMTIGTQDVDPVDGKAHVRFTVAPVLQNPGHSASQQPYYFVQLTNVTKGTVLYKDFNASAQPGVPWKSVGSGGTAIAYTDWQLVDIAPGSAQMGIGDQVELEVIASRCAPTGHFGRVYVDGVGATIPGLYVSGSGPSAANAGENVTYKLSYNNGGTGAASGVVVAFNLPPSTTWIGLDAPGLVCTQPAVGASSGAVSCTVGSVSPGASGFFNVTVKIDAAATGTITAGNYQISGTSINPLLGPKVFTTVTSGITYTDLSITKTNGVAGLAWGQNVQYTIVAKNNGTGTVNSASVQDTMPSQLENISWSCVGANGGICPVPATGTGDIAATVSLPASATATFTVSGQVKAGSGAGTLANTASITVPGGVSDTDSTNNSTVDSDLIGEVKTVTVTKAGNGLGSVVSAPAAVDCGLTCTSAQGSFVSGTTVTFNAVPGSGETFAGWSGACSGTATSCNVTITGDLALSATFTTIPRANGQLCAGTAQCSSGNCVDGVCCNTACAGGASDCQSCALSGLVGTCSTVAANTQCASASCTSGTATPAAVCDGVQTACPAAVATSCGGFSCTGSACKTSCAASSDCVNGYYCESTSSTCKPLVAQGGSCSSAGQCATGFCTDGVCCNNECDDQCEACNLAGSAGTCSAAAGAPVGSRPACATDGSVCGGSCDGSTRGACSYPSAPATCGAASCTAGTATLAALCDGTGSCSTAGSQSCGAYVCGDITCLGDCSVDSQCADGRYCSAGICELELDNGTSCTRDGECGSGQCVDGVCCNTACTGQCEACDVAGSAGTCAPMSGAPRGVRPACASDGSSCGGVCDGTSTTACAYPGAESTCRDAACEDGLATLVAACNGAGSCPSRQTQQCGQYVCGDDLCLGDCTTDAQCATDSYCSAGICSLKLQPGTACSGENQCGSGHCVDGVCCDSSCTGQCEACDVDGKFGSCSPATGAPHGARTACADDGSVCGGACDGTDRTGCGYPAAEVQCRAPMCQDGVATLAAACDGQGACPAFVQQDCGLFLCGADACDGDCVEASDCQAGSYCSAGVCVPEEANGGTCTSDSQCDSGHCVDGVCCDTACEGQCAACNVSGSVGTCSAVSGVPQGGRAACGGSGSCAGSCDGSRLDGCFYPSAEMACHAASCSKGVQSAAASCDGKGDCSAGVSSSCGNYACGTSSCKTSCTSGADCAAGSRCVEGSCKPDGTTEEPNPEPGPGPGSDDGGGSLEGGGFGCSVRPGHIAEAGWAWGLLLVGFGMARRRRAA